MTRYCNTINWQQVKTKVRDQAWAGAIAGSLEAGFAEHQRLWPGQPPLEPSDWSHYYFCTDCAAKLKFDVNSPHKHACSACGKVFTGDHLDGAWRKFAHCAILTNLERAAILAQLGVNTPICRAYLKQTILFYVDHYDQYAIHGKHAGLGKVFPQVLSEAIFILSVERILRLVDGLNLFDQAEHQRIGDLLFRPAVELIKPQITMIHNIHAWMQGAIGACAHFLGDDALLDFAINSQWGWINQLKQGVSKDGLWYEISPTYHFYTLSALLSTAWIAREHGMDLADEPAFKQMGLLGARLAYDNGVLPAYNDGWSGVKLDNQAWIYEELVNLTGDQQLLDILARLYQRAPAGDGTCQPLHALPGPIPTPSTGHARNSISALVYGNPILSEPVAPERRSFWLPDTGLAVLQNENLRVGLKFTPYCGWHDHHDMLAIDVYAHDQVISPDLGTTGYGIDWTKKWHRTSVAHNMVVVNEQPQDRGKASLLSHDESHVCVKVSEAYPNVTLQRSIDLLPTGFKDQMSCQADEASTFDWVFHCVGTLTTTLPMLPVDNFTMPNGYDQIRALQYGMTDASWQANWLIDDKPVILHFEAQKGTEIFIGQCHGSSQAQQLGIIIVRRKGLDVQFNCSINLIDKLE